MCLGYFIANVQLFHDNFVYNGIVETKYISSINDNIEAKYIATLRKEMRIKYFYGINFGLKRNIYICTLKFILQSMFSCMFH